MATSTIEPIHIGLPVTNGDYYRFDELPRLIAESLFPDTEQAEADLQECYSIHQLYEQEGYKEKLHRAAQLHPSEPGYLHVAENSISKHPLEWRMGAVLDSGLVHLDWLNEWGESRRPRLVFSTVAAPKSQAARETAAFDGNDWKAKAQSRAVEIIERQKVKDLYPSQQDIADEISREFRRDGVTGVDGKPLAGDTIKRHALKGISSAQGRRVSTAIGRGK